MTRVPTLAVGGAALAMAVAVSACGSGSSNNGGPAYGKPAAAGTGPTAAKVATRHTKLGTVLVDGRGRTLYLFEKDTGTASSCYGACASIWPPLTTGRHATGAGLRHAWLATSRRHDGKTGVTVNGHPVYTYAGDRHPGNVTGQGLDQFGAEWYALDPTGQKIDHGS